MLEVNPGSETKLSGFTAVSDFRGGTNGNVKTENGKLPIHRSPLIFTDPSALRAPSPSPDVRLGSLTLMRHKMTFSHFSKGFIRPNLGEESGGMTNGKGKTENGKR